jgi:hypothetical protein
MRISTIVMLALAMTASPAVAVDFLGVELCKGSTDTAVDLPIASSLVLESVETGYRLATFDLSFYAADGSLVCVDTISVSILKTGQERAFRDSIRCPGYVAEEVAETRLQFAGGL